MPKKLTTVVHIQMGNYQIKIDRSSPFGNPFKIGPDGDRQDVVWKFEQWLLTGENFQNCDATPQARKYILDHIYQLKGKRIGCWCAPRKCHGDILAKLANE